MNHASTSNISDFDLSDMDIGDIGEDYLLEVDTRLTSRFQPVGDMNAFIDSRVPDNTKMKVKWVMRIFHEWLEEWRIRLDGGNKVFKEFDVMSNEEMDFCFQYFFVEVRKQKGGDLYPPRTLKELAAGLQHYINYTLKQPISIFKDACFLRTREALDASMKFSARQGTVKPTKRSGVVTRDQEEAMWVSGCFGWSSPQQLVDSLIYHLGLHLALRAVKEHRDLEYGPNSQLVLKVNSAGDEFICYTERSSKSKSFGLTQCRREPKMTCIHKNSDAGRCVVGLFKEYISHR